MKIKAIIFDFDGVIHDTFDLAYKAHKACEPSSTIENFRSYFDGNLFEALKKEHKGIPKVQSKFKELEREEFKKLIMQDTVKEEIDLLYNAYPLFIISSNTRDNLDMYFTNNNFTGRFKEILTAEVHTSKQEKFKMIFKKYNLLPNECIFITDTLGDIKEAHTVGVQSIACTWGFHPVARLKKGNPFKIVTEFTDIQNTIQKI